MGLLFSRFRHHHRTSKEMLEALEKDIQSLSQSRQHYQQSEKSFIGYLLILSFFTYLVGAVIFYCYFLPRTWLEGVVNSLPLLLFPLVVYLVKKLLNVYFTHKKAQFDLKLRTLHEEKRRVLNEVMEKETYNTARELLQRFDPSHPSLRAAPSSAGGGERGQQRRSREGEGVRQRPPPQPQTPHPAFQRRPVAMARPQTVPRPHARPLLIATATPTPLTQPEPRPQPEENISPNAPPSVDDAPPTVDMATQLIPPGMCLGTAPGPPVPCPILPRDRSNMDRVVEYLVGDGPNNRYALVCSKCHSHNGMALRDEFEYLAFRCAYCYHLNSARKRKPSLPPPPPPPPPPPSPTHQQSTTSTTPSGSENQSDQSVQLDQLDQPDSTTRTRRRQRMSASGSADGSNSQQ